MSYCCTTATLKPILTDGIPQRDMYASWHMAVPAPVQPWVAWSVPSLPGRFMLGVGASQLHILCLGTFRVYTLGKALLRRTVTTLRCVLIRCIGGPTVWQTQIAKCKCMLKIGLPPTALPPTPMILCDRAHVAPPLSDIPHPASLLLPPLLCELRAAPRET
jgi:hypothetical protein